MDHVSVVLTTLLRLPGGGWRGPVDGGVGSRGALGWGV